MRELISLGVTQRCYVGFGGMGTAISSFVHLFSLFLIVWHSHCESEHV